MMAVPEDQNNVKNNGPLLDQIAIWVIVAVIATLLLALISFSLKRSAKEPLTSLNFRLDSVRLPNLDSTFIIANREFITGINQKFDSLRIDVSTLKDIKAEIEETRKKNEDYFRVMLALIGVVFAVVGFFGFKSISDTRQATIDASKIKAETVAMSTASSKAESTVRDYLKNEGSAMLSKSASDTASKVAEDIAYKTSVNTSEKTAKVVADQYLADIREFQVARNQDIEMLVRQQNGLRARIIELEAKLYGEEGPEIGEGEGPVNNNPNDNEPVV